MRWSAKASDRYTQLARQRITTMQLAVAETFADRVNWNLWQNRRLWRVFVVSCQRSGFLMIQSQS